jgi:hypothetical protein
MQYFHATSVLLQPQSVILRGNWGRIVRKFGHRHNLAMRESVLEHVRDAEFPALPSRFECAFVFDSLDEAVHYVQEKGREPMVVYEIELLEGAAARAHH